MNILKTYVLIISILFTSSFGVFAQCQPELSETIFEVSRAGRSYGISISDNSGCSTPNLLSVPSWITITHNSASNINFTVAPLETSSPRDASIALQFVNGGYRGFRVRQGYEPPEPPVVPITPIPPTSCDGIFGLSRESIEVGYEGVQGEYYQFDTSPSICRGQYTIELDAGESTSWVNIYGITGSGFYLRCNSLEEVGNRSATVYMRAQGGIRGSFRINQDSGCLKYWYPDTDNDGFGDPYSTESMVSCTEPSTSRYPNWATNKDDYCPEISSTVNSGCLEGVHVEDRTYITTKSFDINSKNISNNITYFDDLGKNIQSQSWDVKTGKVWATETKYDTQGRPALSTFSSPIKDGNSFEYTSDFIKDANGNTFDDNDLGSIDIEPSAIGDTENTLGAYYSSEEAADEYQDITSRPYSRTFYDELNPGKTLKTIGGNKVDTTGDGIPDSYPQGFSHSMPAAQELYYAFGKDELSISTSAFLNIRQSESSFSTQARYLWPSQVEIINDLCQITSTRIFNIDSSIIANSGQVYSAIVEGTLVSFRVIAQYLIGPSSSDPFVTSVSTVNSICNDPVFKLDIDNESLSNASVRVNPKITKTVAIDAHGEEVVSFAYTDGQVLATARSGEGPKKNVMSLIGEQGFVDIHLPKGCEGSLNFIGGVSQYKCFDLKTGQELLNLNSFNSGVYRIEAKSKSEVVRNLTFIDESGNINPAIENTLGVTYNVNYYDYSLNYYNDAGNLTSTLPPIGFDNDAYANYNLTGTVSHINENLKSHFKYNTLGQLLQTSSPDEGTAWFKYRTDGQIRFSQNSKQAIAGEFSYTNYDLKARPIESGVFKETTTYLFNGVANGRIIPIDNFIDYAVPGFVYINNNINNGNSIPFSNNDDCSERHFTVYDTADQDGLVDAFGSDNRLSSYQYQAFVSGNVSKTFTQNPATTTTWYSYDIYGRVTWIVQQIDGLDTPKTIDYEYDDVTGAVTKVYYQKGVSSEQFIHKYTYDEDDYSLTQVETSTNGTNFTIHANYEYYETGGLKRTVLAEGLQGIDYVYNLNGALKAINHPSLDPTKDPGGDGNNGVEPDAFGMMIDYYKGDYNRTGNHINTSNAGTDQYNGNIKAVRWNNAATDENTDTEKTYAYSYNRNNWLTAATFGQNAGGEADGTIITRTTEIDEDITASEAIVLEPGAIINTGADVTLSIAGFSESTTDDYGVSNLTYDANGNIQSLKRNKNTVNGSNAMDNMQYHYDPNKPNQLNRVEDLVTGETDAEDIKTQTANNYEYNSIGQLKYNNEEGIAYIYNASGLVNEIKKDNTTLLKFFYNDRGQRVKKESYNPTTGALDYTSVYVRDAAGTPMAIYNNNTLAEHTIYGASRLGVYKRQDASTAYELTDHLGNVRAVIKKETNTFTGTDYYPFGMPMPLRNSLSDYRYAYQGQEKDPETGKEAFQLRLWDARIGRWLTTDPARQYASPYLGMGNNPISRVDPDGGTDNTVTDDYKLNGDGSVELIRETKDEFDQLFDENNDFIGSVNKGFLKKGINIKQDGLFLDVDTKENFHSYLTFITDLSVHVDTEIGGFIFNDDDNFDNIYITPYYENKFNAAPSLVTFVKRGVHDIEAHTYQVNSKLHIASSWFHTHPGVSHAGYGFANPSSGDIGFTQEIGVPGLILGGFNDIGIIKTNGNFSTWKF